MVSGFLNKEGNTCGLFCGLEPGVHGAGGGSLLWTPAQGPTWGVCVSLQGRRGVAVCEYPTATRATSLLGVKTLSSLEISWDFTLI